MYGGRAGEGMITILGHPPALAPYRNQLGCNTHPPDWTPEQVKAWIAERVVAGDEFELVGDLTGLQEVGWLQDEARQLRMQARALLDRAGELEAPVRYASRLVGLD